MIRTHKLLQAELVVLLAGGDKSTHEAALQEGYSALIAAALGDNARAKGMSQIARDAGLGCESLYKALSAEGNPEFATIMKVIAALGLQLHASPSSTAACKVHHEELLRQNQTPLAPRGCRGVDQPE